MTLAADTIPDTAVNANAKIQKALEALRLKRASEASSSVPVPVAVKKEEKVKEEKIEEEEEVKMQEVKEEVKEEKEDAPTARTLAAQLRVSKQQHLQWIAKQAGVKQMAQTPKVHLVPSASSKPTSKSVASSSSGSAKRVLQPLGKLPPAKKPKAPPLRGSALAFVMEEAEQEGLGHHSL